MKIYLFAILVFLILISQISNALSQDLQSGDPKSVTAEYSAITQNHPVYLRKDKWDDATIVHIIPNHSSVKIIDVRDRWYQIQFIDNGVMHQGWIPCDQAHSATDRSGNPLTVRNENFTFDPTFADLIYDTRRAFHGGPLMTVEGAVASHSESVIRVYVERRARYDYTAINVLKSSGLLIELPGGVLVTSIDGAQVRLAGDYFALIPLG